MSNLIKACILIFSVATFTTQSAAGSELSRNERLEIAQSVEQVLYKMIRLYDHQKYGEMLELFTKDARYASPSIGETVGRKNIIEQEKIHRPKGRLSRHLVTNFTIYEMDSDSVTASTYVVGFANDNAFPGDDKPVSAMAPVVGDYLLKFRKVDGEWLISERITVGKFEGLHLR